MRGVEAELKAFPILLDSRPDYLPPSGPTSLLLTPLGTSTLLRHLCDRLGAAGHSRFTVAAAFDPDPEYELRLQQAGVGLEGVVAARELAVRVGDYEPSDWLVLVDPRCFPAVGLVPSALVIDRDAGPRRVRHLVALEAHPGGTTERVQLGSNGTVGRIQRYYDSETWPFTSGVACSLVPVSSLVGAADLPFTSLSDLRRALAARGVPSNDVFLRGGAFDLSRERDLLRLSEQVLLEGLSRTRRTDERWVELGRGAEVDASARLIGPVVVQERAVVGPQATVVGPAVIGPGARVERDAVVAQCVVGPDSVVGPGVTLRHRAVFGVAGPATADGSGVGMVEPTPPPIQVSEIQDRRGRPKGPYPFVKEVFDVVLSALGLVVLSPLLLLIALLVKLESRGPVLFRDRREGKDGRVFDCLKFRTMCVGAEALQRELQARNQVDGPQFKLARDPRATRLGLVLRNLNLDELPQLLNVLRLEMSLVGPRPSPFRENQLCIPWRDARLSVRPGITGLWQVCRNRRLEGDFHQWIHFDLLYVRHMSFLVDVKILALTFLALAAQWPIPLPWIVPRRELEAEVADVKVRAVPVAGPPAELRVRAN